MRRVMVFLLAAGLACALAVPVGAAPPSSNPKSDAAAAASWLGRQVNASGFIPQSSNPAQPNLSVSAQVVTALAAAGVGNAEVNALLAYLGAHVNDFVVNAGVDDPGSLAYLILAARAGGDDPSSFGPDHADLVARLVATQQSSGLFGNADPTFDGAFRQGLSLLALHAGGVTNSAGVAWLEGQQCASGLWTAFRSDTTTPCPPVDTTAFTGPDTNSTALAVLGLHAQGASSGIANALTALDGVRNSGGGWGFLARSDQATDANSTGLVLEAIRSARGTTDTKGIEALLQLQVGCTGTSTDEGGIAFQPGAGGKLVPDQMATVQATPALAEVALPIIAPEIQNGLVAPCKSPSTTTVPATTAGGVAASTTGATSAAATTTQLPNTGNSSIPVALVALLLCACGGALAAGSRTRRE